MIHGVGVVRNPRMELRIGASAEDERKIEIEQLSAAEIAKLEIARKGNVYLPCSPMKTVLGYPCGHNSAPITQSGRLPNLT